MSTHYKHFDTVPSAVLAKRLDELADATTLGPEAMGREFTRRIPAELDRDADLVLSQAAKRLRDLETEREALAAHMERLTPVAVELAETVENNDDLPIHKWAVKSAYLVHQVKRAAKDTPTTSLARRDAEKQAEALEEYAEEVAGLVHSDHMMTAETWHGYLMTEARKRRRQAEGGE